MTHENRGAYEILTTIGSTTSENHLQDIELDSSRLSAFGPKPDVFNSDCSNEVDELVNNKYETDQKSVIGLKSLNSRTSTRTTTIKSVRELQLDTLNSFEIDTNEKPWMQCVISALSAISGFLFGYDLCVMVIALPLIQNVLFFAGCMSEHCPTLIL